MTNFIITGDLHYRLQNPKARLDDYREALEYKLSETYELAAKYSARGIIIPGDIFDSAGVSIPAIYSLAKVFGRNPLARMLGDALCPIITVPGNHDTFSHNLDTVSRTPYGLLRELGYIYCVHDMSMSVHSTNVSSIHISGHGFDTQTDNDITQYCLPNDVFRGINIHVTHGMLLEKPMMDGVKYTLISDLEKLQDNPEVELPHVLINGHYHFGLPITWVGKTLVINPGALGRLTAHAEEMNREIKVALLTISGPEDYSAKFIPLKSAQPGHVVLSREHIEEAKQRDERLDTFLKLLASEGEQKYLELEEIMEGIAQKENIPEDIIKEGLRRLGQAREIISGRG